MLREGRKPHRSVAVKESDEWDGTAADTADNVEGESSISKPSNEEGVTIISLLLRVGGANEHTFYMPQFTSP